MADSDSYISNIATLERLAKLETKVHLKFEELDKALVLAREMADNEKVYAREQTADHFFGGQ